MIQITDYISANNIGYGRSLIFKIKILLYVHINKPNINTFDDQNLVTKNVIALFNFKPK